MEKEKTVIYNLQASDICKSMGFLEQDADPVLLDRTSQLLQEVTAIAKPCYHYIRKDGVELKETSIRIGEVEMNTGKTVTRLMKGSSSLILFVVTAGMEFQQWSDSLKAQDDILDSFIADTIGTTLVGKCADLMEVEILEKYAGIPHTNRFSPGYAGWNLTDQKNLFSFMPPGICGISLTDSCLMYPIKSVSGIMGLGGQAECKVHECDFCNKRDVCVQRKLRERQYK